MNKCDFCTQSSPNGKCFWSAKSVREKYCKEAIKQMAKVFGQDAHEDRKHARAYQAEAHIGGNEVKNRCDVK